MGITGGIPATERRAANGPLAIFAMAFDSALEVSGSRHRHIDVLRAFAVMLVVVAHTNIGGIPGGSGVTMFFAVSGFIITSIVVSERKKRQKFSLHQFYVKRSLKILPPLVVVVLIPTLAYSIFYEITWNAVLAQTFFYANWNQLYGDEIKILPGSSVVWSLAIEEQFYIIFALLWLTLARLRNWRVWLIVVAALVAFWSFSGRLILALQGDMAERIYLGTDTRVEAIALGMLTAVLMNYLADDSGATAVHHADMMRFRVRKLLESGSTVPIAIAIYIVSLIVRDDLFRDTLRFTLQAFAACLLISFGMLNGSGFWKRNLERVSNWKITRIIGLASYSIYLAHDVVGRHVDAIVPGVPGAVRVSLQILAGTATGIAVWMLVEIPIVRKRRNKITLDSSGTNVRGRYRAKDEGAS